ncbi:MAG: shikimate dehydrogenase [Lachnospiraceae bacterium]|nr:shikimate dehydrogenase [Lachnospiraceae bacterium]
MNRYGLIGEKLGHSYSKLIHEKLADYTYDLIPLSKEDFTVFMENREFEAINVTIPYKQAVLPYLDELSDSAKAIGAVNAIINKNGKLYGYNTDYLGFLYTLRQNNIKVSGQKVLIIGNGGAAKAVTAALRSLSPAELITVKYKEEPGTVTYEQAARFHSDASLIVNTSPIGMYPNADAAPMDLSPYIHLEAVVDLIYNPSMTKLLAQAESMGIKAVNGMGMLVAQAKYAVELFLDTEISDDVILPIVQDLFNFKLHQ